MRFALEIGPGSWLGEGPAATAARVRAAEASGFTTVWASEDPDGWDAFAVLAFLAAQTERIALGTGVTNPYLRHPNQMAASIATLDRASQGRAFLGLGRGEPDWYRTAFAMDVQSPLARVEHTVDLLHQWWSPEQVAANESNPIVRNWRREFAPLGRPPIYLAATGPNMQRLAGRKADGMRLNTLASLPFIAGAVRTALAEIPAEQTGQFRVFAHPGLTITQSDAETERVLEQLKGTIALIHVLPGMHQQLNGLEERFPIERILADVRTVMNTDEVLRRGGSFADLRRAGDLGAARKLIPTDLVRELSAVGDPAYVQTRIAEYESAGVTDLFAKPESVRDAGLLAEPGGQSARQNR